MSLVCQSRLLTVLVHGSIPHWHRGAFLDARSVMISLLARGPNWIAAHPAILAASHCRYLWLGAGGEHAVGAGLVEELQLHNLTVCEFQTQQMDQKRVVCDHLSATEKHILDFNQSCAILAFETNCIRVAIGSEARVEY